MLNRILCVAVWAGLALTACSSSSPSSSSASTYQPRVIDDRRLQPLQQQLVVARVALPEQGAPVYDGLQVESGQLVFLGDVDWEQGRLACSGYVRTRGTRSTDWALAEQGSRAAALGNVVKLAAMIRLDEGRLLADLRTGGFELQATIERGQHEVSSPQRFETQQCVCRRATVALHGIQGLVAKVAAIERGVAPQRQAYQGERRVALSERPTDLLIDTRGSHVGPALLPVVRTTDGQVLYDVRSPKSIPEHGLVSYAVIEDRDPIDTAWWPAPSLERYLTIPAGRQVELALLDEPAVRWVLAQRRGRREVKPVVVTNLDQGQQADIIVSAEDAAKIQAAEEQGEVLTQGRVIVVVGSRVAGKRGERPVTPQVAVARR
jgi:hypothetical protein